MNESDLKQAMRRLTGEETNGSRPTGSATNDLESTWRLLDDPGPLVPPPEFATQLRALVAPEVELGPSLALWRAPRLVQGFAAGALAAGLVLGVGVGSWVTSELSTGAAVATTAEDGWVVGTSLADSWASAVEEGS